MAKASAKAGFKYHIEHMRSVAKMREHGIPIDGLERKDMPVRIERKGRVSRFFAAMLAKLGMDRLNFEMVPGVVLSQEQVANLIPTEGLNYMLGASLTGVTPISSWFIALFEGNYTPVSTVTSATFPANATESTAYNEATRVAWTPGTISAGSVSNTLSKAVFTMNATKSIYGIAQTSVSTKSATTGVLVSCAAFAAVKNVVATDVLNVTSTLTATSA